MPFLMPVNLAFKLHFSKQYVYNFIPMGKTSISRKLTPIKPKFNIINLPPFSTTASLDENPLAYRLHLCHFTHNSRRFRQKLRV